MKGTSSPYRPQWLVRFAQSALQIQEEELGRVGLMFLYSLLAVGAFILGRMIRDTLLLSLPREQGIGFLPTLMALSAVAVSMVAYLYSRVANRLRRDRMIMLINLILGLMLLGIYTLLLWMPVAWRPELLQLNYVFIEVMGSLQVIQFWTLASELFNPREARRSFAIIGGGAVLANLLAFAVRPMIKILQGVYHFLPILSGMLFLCIVIVYWLGKHSEQQLNQLFIQKKQALQSGRRNRVIRVSADSERIWSNKHLASIAMIIVLTFLTTTIIDYQFKAVAEQSFPGEIEKLSFFSMFYGVTGILCCIVQFGLARRLLERFGIKVILLLLPFALFAGSFLLGVAPIALTVFWASTMTKGSENVLRYTVYEVSLNLLYVPISSHIRARAKTFIDGILKPAAIGLAAALIAIFKIFSSSDWRPPQDLFAVGDLGAHLQVAAAKAERVATEASILFSEKSMLPPSAKGFVLKTQHLSWIAMLLIVVWGFLILRAHREYLATLVKSMQKNHFSLTDSQFSIQDDSTLGALRAVLQSRDPEKIIPALSVIGQTKLGAWRGDLLTLLSIEHEELQVETLRLLATGKESKQTLAPIQALLSHPSSKVQAQAIDTYCTLLEGDAIDDILPYLKQDQPEVRASAIIGLIQHGGLDGILHAAEHLKHLLEHQEARMREMGARVLGRLGVRNFYQPLLRLIRDSDRAVRTCAIKSAGLLLAPQVIPVLLSSLKEKKIIQPKIRALVAYGEGIFPELKQAFAKTNDPHVQGQIIRVLGHFDKKEIVELMEGHLFESEANLCLKILKALLVISERSPKLKSQESVLFALFEKVSLRVYQNTLDKECLEQELKYPLAFSLLLGEQLSHDKQILFAILALLYPPRQIQLIDLQLESDLPQMRANALELLDNLLAIDYKKPLLPIFEQKKSFKQPAFELYQLRIDDLDTVLDRWSLNTSSWSLTCLLWTIAKENLVKYRPFVRKHLESPNALVRETALIAAENLQIEMEEGVDEYLDTLEIKSFRFVDESISNVEKISMLSTIEKLLFLKRIELFEGLSSDDLIHLTQIAEEVHFEKDELIIKEGELGDALFIIIEGSVKITKEGKLLAVLGEKEPIGEMGILDKAPRSASVTAKDDIRMLKIERNPFRELMADRSEIAEGVIRVLLHRLRNLSASSVREAQEEKGSDAI